MISFKLHPIPPFRLDLTVWVLRRVPINEIDRWDGHTYHRVLVIHGEPVEVSVTQTGVPEAPELTVSLAESHNNISEADIAPIVIKMLGLDIDIAEFYHLAQSDTRLSALANQFAGFKPPRYGTVFEALVNAIACQQISLLVGITLLNRLSAVYGLAVGKHYAFPRPEDLVNALPENLRTLGFSVRKAQNILAISRSVVEGELDLDSLEQMDDDCAVNTLCDINGVGRWTAQYVALRGLGRPDVYPADDVGNQSKLQHWLNLSERPTYEAVHQIVDKWTPYRGLIYFYMLLDGQARQGLFHI